MTNITDNTQVSEEESAWETVGKPRTGMHAVTHPPGR